MRSLRELKAIGHQRWLPFLHALPAYAGTVSLTDVEVQQGSQDFVKALFSAPPAEASVKAGQEEERLQNAFFDIRSWERSLGSNPFALGFPLYLGINEEAQPIAAPLFLWELKLEPGLKQNDGWKLLRLPEHRLQLNPFLLAYWQERFGQDLRPLFEPFLRTAHPRLAALEKLMGQLADALELPESGAFETLAPPLQPADTESAGKLAYAGLLGIFPNQNTLMSADPAGDWSYESRRMPAVYSPIVPGPYQATAAALLQQQGLLWLEGAAATGKTELGLHLLLHALGEGQRCLVVAPQVGELRAYEQALAEQGLSRLSFTLRDTAADKRLFLDLMRAAVNNTSKPSAKPDEEQYRKLTAKLARLEDKLRKPYLASRKEVLKGQSWMETVGEYLASARLEGKELLATQLNASDYDFDAEEYRELQPAVAHCYQLFQQTHTLRSPLSALSPAIFLGMEKEEAQKYVAEKTQALLDKASRLQHWYINRLNAYSDQLLAHFEQYYQRFARELTALADDIAEQSAAYGKDYRQGRSFGLKVKGVFSDRAKAAWEARAHSLETYERLQAAFERTSYFEFAFPSFTSKVDMSELERVLSAFEERLQYWRLSLRETVQEEVKRLSQKSVNPRLGFEQQVVELEESLDRWLADINETGLYHLPFHNKTLTIPKRQRYLEEVMEQLETTRRALPDFDNFYDWQRNWLQLSEKARRLVKALLKLRPEDWQAAYKTWFLDNLLNQHYEAVLPPQEEALEELWRTREQLLPLQKSRSLYYWEEGRQRAFREWRRRGRSSYQSLFKQEPPLSALDLLRDAPAAVQAASPALLMHPDLAVEGFQGQRQKFDLLIVEEAAALDGKVLEQLLCMGKRVLFLSPRGLSPERSGPPPEIAAYSSPSFVLRRFYEERPGNWQQAAYGTKPSFPPEAFYFEQADGRYDEASEANEAEVLRIVSLLNQIERRPQRTFPSVGIVCMTKGQRNKLSALLLGIKQRRSAGVEVIQQLERNGLSILQLEEIGGQQFDILIISSTFGPIDLSGGMPGHYHRLESPAQQEQLLQLMSRARERVMVINSLPEAWLDEAAQAEACSADRLLPAYLAFVRACAQCDEAAIARLAATSRSFFAENSPYRQPSAYWREIQRYLHPYLGEPGMAFDPAADGAEAPAWAGQQALLADGFFGLCPAPSLAWEYQCRERLHSSGHSILSTWSPNWWRQPELEARQIASQLWQQQPQEEEE